MESRPIIFLDVDGVLHPFHGHQNLAQVTTFHRECMNRLGRIVTETGAEIVLSSSWRNFTNTRNRLLANLSKYDMAFTRWIEPDSVASIGSVSASKVGKILSFVQTHNPADWIILDDENLITLSGLPTDGTMVQLFASRFIRTDPVTGISDQDVEQAISILQDRG